MKVKSIADHGAFCNTFDLHNAIIRLEKTTTFFSYLSGLLRQALLYTIKFNGYPIREVRKKISVKQGRVRGNKNIFKVSLESWSSCTKNLLQNA